MDRKTETQLRQEIAEVWALLDTERAGRAALIRRIEQEEQSVAVVGEPIYWIDPDDDANLSRISRVGWSPLYGESPASIPAADLATLREKAAEADELRKDAEKERDRLKHKIQSLCVLADLKPASDASESLCLLHQHIQELAAEADELRECKALLSEARKSMRQYEADCDEYPPFHHNKLMERIDAAIAQGQTK